MKQHIRLKTGFHGVILYYCHLHILQSSLPVSYCIIATYTSYSLHNQCHTNTVLPSLTHLTLVTDITPSVILYYCVTAIYTSYSHHYLCHTVLLLLTHVSYSHHYQCHANTVLLSKVQKLLFKCRFVAWWRAFPHKSACVHVKINKRLFESFCVWILYYCHLQLHILQSSLPPYQCHTNTVWLTATYTSYSHHNHCHTNTVLLIQ